MKIKVIYHPRKTWTRKIASEAKKLLRENGHRIARTDADATICIGGDGTILYANYKNRLEGNVLGIGSGRSYICQLRRDNWKKELLKKLKEKTDKIWMLGYSTGKRKNTAINDIVIHTKDYRVIELNLKINGKKHTFLGDGLIVSSGVGSTCYAYSAGGKKTSPQSKQIQVVPIAPYRRKFKSISLKGNEIITVKADRKCALIVDGIYIKELKKNETVKIKRDGYLKFFKGVGWYE